ncbi:MAG: hypothetical protein ACUVXE_09670, partial [Anaerolineae bacterium]
GLSNRWEVAIMTTNVKAPLIIGAFLLLFILHLSLYKGFIVDDAFITFRYVQNLTRGYGLVYNIGERVEGYSNFLWILLLAPFAALGIELVVAAKALGALLGALTLYLTWRAARQQIDGPTLAPLFLAASAPFAAWSMGGLETLLFTFLVLCGGYIFLQEETRGRGYLSGLLFGLLSLTRPEGLIFLFVTIAFKTWQLYRSHTHPNQHDFVRLLLAGIVIVPYFLWRLTYYGYPLPNTVYAKSLGFHPRAFLEGFVYLYQSIESIGGFFFLALPFLSTLTVAPLPLPVSYWLLNIGAYTLFTVLGGGDWMPLQRFAVHILPPVYLMLQAGMGALYRLWRFRWHRAVWTILVVGQVGYLLGSSLEQRFVNGIGGGPLIPEDTPVIAYIRQNAHPGDTIAVTDAGLIAYRLPPEVRIIDMVGLTDAHIAHQPVRLPGGLLGRGDAFGKWDIGYVLRQRPRLVQVNIIGQAAGGEWLTNFTGTTLLVNDPRFRQRYRPVDEIHLPGLFIRREG